MTCKLMVALNSVDWPNNFFHLLCSLHNLCVVVISVDSIVWPLQVLDGLNLSRVRSESMLVVLLRVVNWTCQLLKTLHLFAELIELVLVVNIHDGVVHGLQGVDRFFYFHKLAAVVALIDWPRHILDSIHLFCNFIEGALVVARHDWTKLRFGQLSQVLLNLAVAVLELLQLVNWTGQLVELFRVRHDHIVLIPLIHINGPSHGLDSVGTFENFLERVTGPVYVDERRRMKINLSY